MPPKTKSKTIRRSLSELVPKEVSHAQVLRIVEETGAGHLDEYDIAELSEDLNRWLWNYHVILNSPSRKQSSETIHTLRFALKRVVEALPEPGSDAFGALVSAGNDFARRHGGHSGLIPIHHPAGPIRPPSTNPNKRTVPGIPAWTDYRTLERLTETFAYLEALSKWLHKPPAIPERPRLLSPIVQLIGGDLPRIFEQAFGRKFGNGRVGPGARFVKAVLSIGDTNSPVSAETIRTYRTQWLNRRR